MNSANVTGPKLPQCIGALEDAKPLGK